MNCRSGYGDGKTPLVTVVIPAWNNADLLPRCLRGLRAQRFSGFATIVVDNASDDATEEVVVTRFPEIGYIRLPENRGFAAAVNVGAHAATTPYVAFLNSDTDPEPAWLGELLACLERHPRAACVDSKLVRLHRPDVIDGAGDGMTWSLKAYRRGLGEIDRGQYDSEEQIFSASGTACLWRRDVLEAIGLFDESFFAYYEDVDLGFRARLAGYEAWYAPQAVVRHVGSASSRSRRRHFEARALRNRWAVILRDAPDAWLRRHWAAIALGELLLAARLLATGNPLPVLRAYLDVTRQWRTWLDERPARQPPAAGLESWRPLVHETFPPFRMSLRRHA
jgi:GT2 family glycosyltransferase